MHRETEYRHGFLAFLQLKQLILLVFQRTGFLKPLPGKDPVLSDHYLARKCRPATCKSFPDSR